MKKIAFSKPTTGPEEIREVSRAIRSGWLAAGERVLSFEKLIGDYTGRPYVKALNSCTAALQLAVLACGIGKGDEVITPALTFCATVNAIIHSGAKPVLADIDRHTLTIDPRDIEKKITSKTKAVLIMHYGGLPCDMTPILSLARRYKLKVIADAAHAIGSRYRGKDVAALCDVACFSFHAAKNMTTGEGGALVTADKKIYTFVSGHYFHGFDKEAWQRHKENSWEYDITGVGFKYNMSDLAAALGIHQIKKLDAFIEKRARIAAVYEEVFQKEPLIFLQEKPYPVRHSHHLFPIILDLSAMTATREKLIGSLRQKGIMTSVHFIPVYEFSAYGKIFTKNQRNSLVNTREVFPGLLSLPIYPRLTLGQARYVARTVRDFVQKYKK